MMEKSPEQSRVCEKRSRAGKAGILRLSITYGFTVSSKDKYTRTWDQCVFYVTAKNPESQALECTWWLALAGCLLVKPGADTMLKLSSCKASG